MPSVLCSCVWNLLTVFYTREICDVGNEDFGVDVELLWRVFRTGGGGDKGYVVCVWG